MSKCVITFNDNPDKVYYNGQVLRGTAVLTTVRPKTVSAIYIQVTGSSNVRWWEKQGWTSSEDGKQASYKTYTGTIEHFSSKIYVAGSENVDMLFQLPAGTHSYDFEVQLPQEIPSSVISKNGTVEYEISLTIDRPNKYSNNFRTLFTVVQTVDLNKDLLVQNLVRLADKRNGRCNCLCSNFVEVIASTPYTGYASGQAIPFNVSIDNQTGRKCINCKVELLKMVHCKSTLPEEKTMVETIKLREQPIEDVEPKSSIEYSDNMEIPSTPPTSQKGDIVEVSYSLKVIVNAERKNDSIELTFPIKIGTVPLRVRVRPAPPAPSAPLLELDDLLPQCTFEAALSYGDAVVSYEDHLNGNHKNSKNCENFVPKYPCFRGFKLPVSQTWPRGTRLVTEI